MRAKRLVLLALLFLLMLCTFSNAAQLSRTYRGVSLRYEESLTPQQVDAAITFAQSEKNTSHLYPSFWSETTDDVASALRKSTATGIVFKGEGALCYAADFISGGYPGSGDKNSAAISSALASELFGSVDVQGLEILWQKSSYKISGVFQNAKPMLLLSAAHLHAEKFTCVELFSSLSSHTKADANAAALAFARGAGLPVPNQILYGASIAFMGDLASFLPVVLAAILLFAALVQKSKTWQCGHQKMFWLFIILCLSAGLPLLFAQLPLWLIPTKWSDFSFWSTLYRLITARIEEYFMLVPYVKDGEAKFTMLHMLVLIVAQSITIAILMWQTAKKKRL